MKQLFFLQGQLIAEQQAKPITVHAQRQMPFGKAFFCPECAEIWAQSLIEGRRTFVEHILCERHPATSTSPLPGSLWLSWDLEWNRSLPQELLEREFLLLTKEI